MVNKAFDQQTVSIVGIVLGILLSLSPIPTFIEIAFRSKTTGGYTVAPYLASFMCSSIWLTYAFLAGSSRSDLIPLNAISFVIYFIYCAIFLRFASSRSRTLWMYMGALGALALTVIAAVFVKSLLMIGILATIANCLMFVAPLAVMGQVIKTRSVRYMPFLLSLSSFLCGCVWLIWALLADDMFVLIPNAIGAVLGLFQLVLYGIYWRLSRNEKQVRLPGQADRTAEEEMTPMRTVAEDVADTPPALLNNIVR